MNFSKKIKYLMIILIILFLFIRFVNLDADRPLPIFARASDEFFKAGAAIYKINFGTWINDDENSGLVHTPLFPFLVYPIYKLLGVSLSSTRILSVFAGILSIIFLYLILRKENKKVALLASFLLAINHLFFILNRVGLPESIGITVMLISFYVISLNEKKVLNYSIAGFVMGLAFLLKASLVYFMVAVLIFLIIQKIKKTITFKHITYYAISYAFVLIIYFIYIKLLPNYIIEPMIEHTKIVNFNYLFIPRSIVLLVDSIFGYPSIFLLSILAIIYIVRQQFRFTLKGCLSYIKNLNFTEKFAFSWLIGSIISVCFTSIMPRRIIPIVIPLVIYPGLLLFSNKRSKTQERHPSISLIDFIIPCFLIFSFVVNYLLYLDNGKYLHKLAQIFVFKTTPSFSSIIQSLFKDPVFIFMLFLLLASITIFIVLYMKLKKSDEYSKIKFKRNLKKWSLFSLISLITLGLIKVTYRLFIQQNLFKISGLILVIISLTISYFLFCGILKKSLKTTKYLLGTYIVYCIAIIVVFSLIFPSFLVKEANQKIDELTDDGDCIIGYYSHSLSIESRTRPISYKFRPEFQKFINYSIFERHKPKLYFKPIGRESTLKKDDIPHKLNYLGLIGMNRVFGFLYPYLRMEVYEIDYTENKTYFENELNTSMTSIFPFFD